MPAPAQRASRRLAYAFRHSADRRARQPELPRRAPTALGALPVNIPTEHARRPAAGVSPLARFTGLDLLGCTAIGGTHTNAHRLRDDRRRATTARTSLPTTPAYFTTEILLRQRSDRRLSADQRDPASATSRRATRWCTSAPFLRVAPAGSARRSTRTCRTRSTAATPGRDPHVSRSPSAAAVALRRPLHPGRTAASRPTSRSGVKASPVADADAASTLRQQPHSRRRRDRPLRRARELRPRPRRRSIISPFSPGSVHAPRPRTTRVDDASTFPPLTVRRRRRLDVPEPRTTVPPPDPRNPVQHRRASQNWVIVSMFARGRLLGRLRRGMARQRLLAGSCPAPTTNVAGGNPIGPRRRTRIRHHPHHRNDGKAGPGNRPAFCSKSSVLR